MSAAGERYEVVCDDYRVGNHASREAAERALERVEQAGHCSLPHRVEAKR